MFIYVSLITKHTKGLILGGLTLDKDGLVMSQNYEGRDVNILTAGRLLSLLPPPLDKARLICTRALTDLSKPPWGRRGELLLGVHYYFELWISGET